MKRKDLFLPIIRNNIAPRFVPAFSKNILRPNNDFTYRVADRCPSVGHGVPVA